VPYICAPASRAVPAPRQRARSDMGCVSASPPPCER
jgi:hypothetical protein